MVSVDFLALSVDFRALSVDFRALRDGFRSERGFCGDQGSGCGAWWFHWQRPEGRLRDAEGRLQEGERRFPEAEGRFPEVLFLLLAADFVWADPLAGRRAFRRRAIFLAGQFPQDRWIVRVGWAAFVRNQSVQSPGNAADFPC